jgi:hypothetical protein
MLLHITDCYADALLDYLKRGILERGHLPATTVENDAVALLYRRIMEEKQSAPYRMGVRDRTDTAEIPPPIETPAPGLSELVGEIHARRFHPEPGP